MSQQALQQSGFHCHFSEHALKRMSQRGITHEVILMALQYGRMIYVGGCRCYVIGRKELEHYSDRGVQLNAAEGIHVLVAAANDSENIITVYRNRKFLNIKSMLKRRR